MRSKRRHRRSGSSEINLGFQIAPMIDVVFVILLYFMVMAGKVKKENAHNTKLPGTEPAPNVTLPDEVAIQIDESGQVYLNEDPNDSPTSTDLTELRGNLRRIKEGSGDTPILVTIYSEDSVKYSRMIDVCDALSAARINNNITFQASGD